MAAQQALTKRENTALAQPSDPIQGLTVRFPSNKYNVLAPVVHMDRLPEGTRLVVTEVSVNADKKAKETFAIAGGDLMLAKVVLDRVAQAAGVSWDSVRRIDDGKHPHYYHVEVKGHMTDFDGTVRQLCDAKAIDLREDAGGGVPGKDYEEIVRKARSARPPRDPSGQLQEARKFIQEIAASKAKNRALACGLGIKRSYSQDDLKKPFIVPKLVLDPSLPAARELIMANAAGATAALYGARQHVIDATFEEATAESDPAYSPGVQDSGEEEGESAVPSAAPPSSDTDDVGGPAVKAIMRESWAKATAAGMSADNFRTLCASATGKQKKDEMTPADARAVLSAVEAFVANAVAQDEEDDGMPV